MTVFNRPNAPLNLPALEALRQLTGGNIPPETVEALLNAPFNDDLSGLRLLAHQLNRPDPYDWNKCNQPKKKIGDYVESMGFSVPKRYKNLEEALAAIKQGRKVILRSEHRLEYDSFSGLLESHKIDQNILRKNDKKFIQTINKGACENDALQEAKLEGMSHRLIERYLDLAGQNFDEYYDEMSFSFWEYIPGRNITIVADDAIEGRYHITSYGSIDRGGALGGIFNGAGEPFDSNDKFADSLSSGMSASDISRLINEYEKIRVLPRFSPTQCPIMEMQFTDDGKILFLQYHKARSFSPSFDRLDETDYPAEEGWLKAQIVRGALGRFVTLQTAIWYPEGYKPSPEVPGIDPEDASFDMHYDVGLSEYLVRRRAAYFTDNDAYGLYSDMADGNHARRSRWFKPVSSFALGRDVYDSLLSYDKVDKLKDAVFGDKLMGRFTVDAASDGQGGYVRLSPDAEQPTIGVYL